MSKFFRTLVPTEPEHSPHSTVDSKYTLKLERKLPSEREHLRFADNDDLGYIRTSPFCSPEKHMQASSLLPRKCSLFTFTMNVRVLARETVTWKVIKLNLVSFFLLRLTFPLFRSRPCKQASKLLLISSIFSLLTTSTHTPTSARGFLCYKAQ